MQLRTRTWFLISLLCLVGAGIFWHLGNKYEERRRQQQQPAATNANTLQKPEIVKELGPLNYQQSSPLTGFGATNHVSLTNYALRITNSFSRSNLLSYRLTNTAKPIGELTHVESALLLRNALIDNAGGSQPVSIPEHLRSKDDPGAYVVQANGYIDDTFRSYLKAADGEIITYLPNNAYLVRFSEQGAAKMRSYRGTLAVLPWEPYYKLDLRLLPAAVHGDALPPGTYLNVLLFPGERESGIQAIEALGARVELEQRSPFGHQLTIAAAPDSLTKLAQLTAVQGIEPHARRATANDLGRPRIGAATNSVTAVNHLGLTGQGVQVALVDTGVDPTHPDLQTNRVFGLLGDPVGHGTHVAATIIGNGSMSSTVVTNPPGSTNIGWNFRGVAPEAKVFSMPIDTVTGPVFSEQYLQEEAARNTNYIVNNSWGYPGLFQYDLSAASYDAAVRDALMGEPGSQPLVMVFAAGNAGDGSNEGQGGAPDSITSPATAKNVITVGAVESLRNITNEVIFRAAVTNGGSTNGALVGRPFLGPTDSTDQIASFSSRGNVGIGLEGAYGRFKPDVVAPGSMIISARSSNWIDPDRAIGTAVNRLPDQAVERGETNMYSMFVPLNATTLGIRLLTNAVSRSRGLGTLLIYAGSNQPPVLDASTLKGTNQAFFPVSPGIWWFAVVNSNNVTRFFDLQTVLFFTNNVGNYFQVLSNMNAKLAPWYRYESGTSMAAGFASGSLALMQEFFTTPRGLNGTNPSPALMKAMLINGARSLPCARCPQGYDFSPASIINYQGWGLINVSNSLPRALQQTPGDSNRWPMVFYDQDPANSLATGDSHTRTIRMNPQGQGSPLRITLVWTDPPGNPAASLKLVNDLDLIVTNRLTREYYIGNNFPPGNTMTAASITNDFPQPERDVVNNVENVYIDAPLADTYEVVVQARRVNVNAVTGQTNGVLQDYALVISSGNSASGGLTNPPPFQQMQPMVKSSQMTWYSKHLTNQQALVNERVGANNPLRDPAPNEGYTNQWNFYVFARSSNPTNWGDNVAIATFLAPNASRPRIREADIDLYVSTDPGLTNLNSTVLADAAANRNNSWSSRTRLGTESVILPGIGANEDTFYIAVKAEDQQASDFGIMAVATDLPLGGGGADGNIPLFFFPIGPVAIPDGSAERPGGTNLMAFVFQSEEVRRIIITNSITHENAGDLIGILSHDQDYAILNNHREFPGLSELAWYDDSGENDIPGARGTDGPGSLQDFEGKPAQGVWFYTIIDNAPFQIGQVNFLTGLIEPQLDIFEDAGLLVTDLPQGKWKYFTLELPPGVTNMIVNLYNIQPDTGVLDVYLRRGARPTPVNFDKYKRIPGPGGFLSCSIYDDPPLLGGRYTIGVSNAGPSSVSFRIRVDYQYSLTPIDTLTYVHSPSMPLLDNAVTNDLITVTNEGNIADVKVGVRLDHPRLSDLVFHLVSPQGTRVLLAENRGGLYAPTFPNAVTNLGAGSPTNYVVPFASSGQAPEFATNLTVNSDGTAILRVDYVFFRVPDAITVYCGPRAGNNLIFSSGYISGSGTFDIPIGNCTDVELVVNEGANPAPGTEWRLTVTITGPWNYATFTDNPNLGGMYKFEPPPFFTPSTNFLVLSNSFEDAGEKVGLTNIVNYGVPGPGPVIFENWRVLTNGVAVITDTNFVPFATGSNYLALSHGQVSLPLTNLVPDRDYTLSFAYRKISSAPTQQVVINDRSIASTVYAVRANADLLYYIRPTPLPCPGGPPVVVPKLRVCPGQEVRITASNGIRNPTAPVNGYPPQGDTNGINGPLGYPYALIGCWSSHPTRLDPQTIASGPFPVGASNVVTAPAAPGEYYLFLGINHTQLCDLSGGFDVAIQWQQCQYSSAEYALGSSVKPLVGEFYWQREKLRFVANPSVTNLTLRTNINTTMVFDDFRIEETISTVYYQSEEPMTPLHGELAAGDWRLEIWDTRAGPAPLNSTNTAGILFSWALTLTYGQTAPPIGLTNGVDYTGVVRGDQIRYFKVAVPLEVNAAANTVFSSGGGSGVELIYSPFGLPQGASPPDPVQAIPEGPIPTLIIDPTFPPAAGMPRGRNYFLAVRNSDPTEVNLFTIRADFDIPVFPLTSGVEAGDIIGPNPNPLAAQKDNTFASVPYMHYWYFDVTNGALSSKFEVTANHAPGNSNVFRNLNLVLKRALPVVDLFPTPFNYDYQATEPDGRIHDLIFVNSNSMPVKLDAGRWYVGVYNFTTNVIEYRLRATQSDQILYTYTNLVDAAQSPATARLPFVVEDRAQMTNFFRFICDQTNAAVLFEIFDMDGDVDLMVRRSDLPSSDLYDFSFLATGHSGTAPGFGYEPVVLRTNLYIPHLNATNWWLAVMLARDPDGPGGAAAQDGPITATICAKTFTNINPIVGCVFDATATATNLPSGAPAVLLTWTSVPGTTYQPQVTDNALQWQDLGVPVTPGAGFGSVTDTNLTSGSVKLYRIRTVP